MFTIRRERVLDEKRWNTKLSRWWNVSKKPERRTLRGFWAAIQAIWNFCVCKTWEAAEGTGKQKCSGWLIWKCNVRFGNVQCQKNVVLSHLGQRYLLETWTSKDVHVARAGVTLMPLSRAKSLSNGMPVMNRDSRADLHEAQALRNMMPSSKWPQNYALRVQ